MNNTDNKLDELLRSRLEQFTPEPPPGVWEKVQAGLAASERKKRVIWLRWVAVAAVLLIALTTGILTLRENQVELPQVAVKPAEPLSKTPQEEHEIAKGHSPASVTLPTDVPGQATPSMIPASTESAGKSLPESLALIALPARESLPALQTITATIRNPFLETRLHPLNYPGMNGRESLDPVWVASAMDYPEPDRGQKNWKVGVQLSPYYSSYSADHSESYARNMTYSENRSQAELGAGISVQYKASDKWRIESGVYYSQTGDKSANSGNLFGANADFAPSTTTAGSYFNTAVKLSRGEMAMNSTAGVIQFSKPPSNSELITIPETLAGLSSVMLTPGEFYQVFDFMEIPLNVRYRLFDSSFTLELLSGVSTNILVGNNVYMGTGPSRENVGRTGNISQFCFAGVVGVGVNYPVGKNLSISLEPRASYYLNSINQSRDVDFRPWKVGIYTGLNYEF